MDRKSESKSNLNESTLPLLDDEANKEKIELEEKDQVSSDDTANVDPLEEKIKSNNEGKNEDDVDAKRKKEEEKERKRQQKLEEEEKKKQLKLEKQKKKEEEKQLKKQKKAEKKAASDAAKATNGTVNGTENNIGKNWNAYNQFTTGINLLDRDEKSINDHVNVSFEDVIGEPDATQGFEAAYRLSFGLFQFVRFWVYRILMFVFSVPLALLWAVLFAVLSIFSVWVLTPAFRVVDIGLYFIHRIWNGLVRTFLDPVFSSVALLRQNNVSPLHKTPTLTTSGRSVVYNNGAKYDQLDTNETYKKSNAEQEDDNQVALNMEAA